MKYALMFVEEGGKPSPDVYEKIGAWWGQQAPVLRGGEELQGAGSATTVRFHNGQPMVSDGPYLETKETIGGFALIEVADLDAALAVAKTWPGGTVEVRPIIDHSDGEH